MNQTPDQVIWLFSLTVVIVPCYQESHFNAIIQQTINCTVLYFSICLKRYYTYLEPTCQFVPVNQLGFFWEKKLPDISIINTEFLLYICIIPQHQKNKHIDNISKKILTCQNFIYRNWWTKCVNSIGVLILTCFKDDMFQLMIYSTCTKYFSLITPQKHRHARHAKGYFFNSPCR